MTRGFLLVMDSLGIGAAEDSGPDAGADTLGNILAYRKGQLHLPNLERLGLFAAHRESRGLPAGSATMIRSAWGYAVERSRGKDTPSGHWEMMGVPVETDWAYFPSGPPSFPNALTRDLITAGGLPGLLGDRHASGTQIIEELGTEHIATGKPIIYSSADSVLQIAAHEEHFGLDRLLALCRTARKLADSYNIGRVIARPFTGSPGCFRRTANRHDYAVPPPAPTLLDRLIEAGREVQAIGKISDIFAARGISRSVPVADNAAGFAALSAAMDTAPDGSLVFINFNDFDTLYGHRRDPAGYAAALEAFDAALPAILAKMIAGDRGIITADHGCDPTWPGSDHTREHVPVLSFGPGSAPRRLGRRDSFADIGQTLAAHLGIAPSSCGASWG